MRGAYSSAAWLAGICGIAAMLALGSAESRAQTPPADGIHLGVASCAGSTCHGAVQRLKGASVAQDEYITWSRKDKHAKAYSILLEDRSIRIARNLGLPDAKSAQICLDCHADNVPEDKRGRQFQISDGVGCESCHGGAETWLGPHIAGSNHRTNLAAGLFPTENPVARAEKCLSCHFGDDKRVMTHKIMGAGHPQLTFELDTFTALEPAHFHVDKTYIERKGAVNDVQVWAVGQAMSLVKFTDAVLDPKNAPKGIVPELYLFDCQACHHGLTQVQWEPRSSTGLPPGMPRLYDANAVMLRIIAARIAPEAAKSVSDHMLAMHKASGESWSDVQREAGEVRKAAQELIPALSQHNFTKEDMTALAQGLVAMGVSGDDLDYAGAEQATMALSAISTAMKGLGELGEQQVKGMGDAMKKLYDSVSNNEAYKPEAFVLALKEFQSTLALR